MLAWTLTHEQIDERTEIATPNRTMLHDQSRANERKGLQHFGTGKRDSVPKSSRDVSECQASAEIGLESKKISKGSPPPYLSLDYLFR